MILQTPQLRSNRGSPGWGGVIGWLLALHLLLALGLQFAPSLHREVHADADTPGHDCLLTVLQNGSVELFPTTSCIVTSTAIVPAIRVDEHPVLLPALAERLLPGRAPPAFA